MKLRGPLLFVGYQLAWWAGAALARAHRAAEATALMLAFAALALATSPRRAATARLMAASVAVGVLLDGGMRAAGLLAFSSSIDAAPAPPFMMSIWAAFACVLPIPWVSARPLAGAVAGALGGVLAYRAGAALELLRFTDDVRSTLALALAWAIALPLLGALALRLDVDGASSR